MLKAPGKDSSSLSADGTVRTRCRSCCLRNAEHFGSDFGGGGGFTGGDSLPRVSESHSPTQGTGIHQANSLHFGVAVVRKLLIVADDTKYKN